MFRALPARARLLVATVVAVVAVLLPGAAAWAPAMGSSYLCATGGLCGSSSQILSAPVGTTVYGNAGGLAGGTTFDVKAAPSNDPGGDACFSGTTWYTATSSGSSGGLGGWSSQSLSLSGIAPNTYQLCAVPRTGNFYSARWLFTVSSAGGAGTSADPAVSGDGRFVAFDSAATTLVSGDTNARTDVFVRDRGTGATTRVSLNSFGGQVDGASLKPAISADGRYVAFSSYATNLVAGDDNGVPDIFVRDRSAGTTTRVSVSSAGVQANSESDLPSISGDGRYVAFRSWASNLVAGDTNGTSDIFVRDTVAGTTTRVDVSSFGAEANAGATSLAISGDGRHVVFTSFASNLVSGDTNGASDVFVHDLVSNLTTLASQSGSGAQAIGVSDSPSISADGRYVAFRSDASNLVAGDTNGTSDVFVRDTVAASTVGVSADAGLGRVGNGASRAPSISGDGRYVAFSSTASNLVPADTNATSDIFESGPNSSMMRLSYDDARGQGNGASDSPALSADGSAATFTSQATNLSIADVNGVADILVHIFNAARTVCYVGRVSVPGPAMAVDTRPRVGQVVYRVWGGGADEFGRSWTPVDPRSLGADQYRISAGLPDRVNLGTRLTIATLNSTAGVIAKPSDPIGPKDGAPPGVAYRSYDGGLTEYLIADTSVLDKTSDIFLSPFYGGPPVGCTPSTPPALGCVGEYVRP